MSESFVQLFNETISNQSLYPGALVRAKVIRIDPDYVVVDAGLKSEGWILTSQFKDAQGELQVALDNEVDVVIEALEDGLGETRLSREKARRLVAWGQLQKAFEDKTTVLGRVTGRVKGGFTVDIIDVEVVVQGFLPNSLVDVRPIRDHSVLEGKELDFQVIKLDVAKNNIVLSRRAVLEVKDKAARESLLAQLAEGQEVEGEVKNLVAYGAFIGLGGIDGLLHNIDISWKRVRHASEILTPGEKIKVVVLKIDKESGRVSLGLKQLTEDPWSYLAEHYPVGSRVQGKVTNIKDYGCFVALQSDEVEMNEYGVEGLVHNSEMDWANPNANPHKIVQVGLKVEVMVLDIDAKRRRISLGMKQCTENPWAIFAEQHTKGECIEGVVKSVTEPGLLIGLEGRISGFVHRSEITDNPSNADVVRQFKKGDAIKAIILSIDPERSRITLSIKQVPKDEMVSPE